MLEKPNRCESLPRSSTPGVARPGESFLHNKNVNSLWKDGIWTVVWVRPLKLTNPDDKALTVVILSYLNTPLSILTG